MSLYFTTSTSSSSYELGKTEAVTYFSDGGYDAVIAWFVVTYIPGKHFLCRVLN